ncbi:MAG: 3'(2'),5'-bisphosphate nucleotidase [Chloroflexi bacterium]|nr:3'(2'),5'-bisphosphate nucleotidase [Chloroflexota bacterium]
MPHTREKQIAIEAVTQAASLCQMVRAEMVQVDSVAKTDRSPVTVADLGAQALLCHRLSADFPEDAIVGEEDSQPLLGVENTLRLAQVVHYVQRLLPDATPANVCDWIDRGRGKTTGRFWTLDPIDGTKGFMRGEQYAIALSLIVEGQVRVAALACPALPESMSGHAGGVGTLFVATRGEGAMMARLGARHFVPIHVATESHQFRLVESTEAGHGNWHLQEAVARAVNLARPPLRMDSQAKYGVVARGEAALYLRFPSPQSLDYREKIWDHAAGTLIVEEAGGCVTDMQGQALCFAYGHELRRNHGIITSNGVLHDAVLRALAGTDV